MRQSLLAVALLFLIGFTAHAKNEREIVAYTKEALSTIDDPTANMTGSATICPGNTAAIAITGTPNCTVTIVNDATPASTYAAYIGADGTGIFTTPILQQTTLYTLINVKLFGSSVPPTIITGVTVLITVIPSGCSAVTISTPGTPLDQAICNIGECRTLVATPTPIATTTTYEVTAIPYCPQAPYYQPWYNQVPMNGDDIWSSAITLPFNFCFFNNTYNSFQIGSNGLVSFNPQTAPGYCFYQMNSMNIPNPAFIHLNAIFGALQDTDPRTTGLESPSDVSINWTLTGTYPCRKLIVNFYHLGQYQCNQLVGLQTSQIVLHEVSNVIDVYIQNRTRCATFNNGEGVIGIINNTGTIAYAPPGRNTADNWTATNEAWRFTPNGPAVPFAFEWLENGNLISNNPTTVVCPATTSTYVARTTYQVCGVPMTVSSEQTLLVVPDTTQNPVDLMVCHSETGNYTADLTGNSAIILGSINPFDYSITFHQTLADAEYGANPIDFPEAYAFTANQTIYASITNENFGCIYVKPFQLIIADPVSPPTGITPQNFTPGQTLADLIVNGTNILWYDAPVNGNLLPSDTLLEDGVTYYASQSNAIGCESRLSGGGSRLAITALSTLGTIDFNHGDFRVYPNPTTGNVTITSLSTIESVVVYNAIGQQLTKKASGSNNVTIDLSNVSSGIYFLQITSNQTSQTTKIIKE